ncbi:TetR family transcriptional regulator [Nonomuraea sp. KC401]|uniref:TetR/AcrR family transcriptional regulator n=1 Tax=unclassified Nonomuraea TaxID=2593643 RepID=UPI0010FD9C7B|nr:MULTISPECIES: TetR/AcrR family transcriptional regulator [unclassified Nonomuraea]NBE92361.1 TetR family transcriptional regulator [Nonomuraea sp. K271]TLF81838.1 TetR family transcriptional regulator [Nonomuraea sp. KC401]
MTEATGLRQRKKERTRRQLIDAALRLFKDQGYEQTTINQIAEAAELSPSTFFLHFSSKDDVVFAEHRDRIDLPLLAIRDRTAGEPPLDVLVRAINRVAASERELLNIASESGRLRVSLLLSVPALRARALLVIMDAQRQVAAELQTTYPDILDPVGAATMVGLISGAVVGAAIAAVEADMDCQGIQQAVTDALNTAARAFRP